MDNYEVCGHCLGNRWRIFLDENDNRLIKACVVCNPKGDKQVGIKLFEGKNEITLRNFNETVNDQQDYVQMVFEEFQESAKNEKIFIKGTNMKRKKLDPESVHDFLHYLKTRLCVQTL